jgi:hypothetical protein
MDISSVLNAAIANVLTRLKAFAVDPLFTEKLALVFWGAVSPKGFEALMAALPEIEVLSNDALPGALEALSAQTGKMISP